MKSKQKALLAADLAREKKAEDIVILDMTKVSNITDFLVIASSCSTRRAQAIAENIGEGLRKPKEPRFRMEGYHEARWIVIDAHDVVAHIFTGEARRFYNLEGLWVDASKVRLCQKKKKTSSRSKKTSKRK